MDSQRLLRELAKREIVPKGVIKKLESKLADTSDQPSPRAVAKFLVDNGHLTVAQAKRVLRATLTPEESAILDATPLSVDEPQDDGVADLPSLSGVSATASSGEGALYDPASAEGGAPAGGKQKKKKQKNKKKKGQSEWDSPLMLLGAGGLVLLLLVGGAILFLLNYESADQRFNNAQDAYENSSYPQAIADFEEFLEKHPNHANASLARVRLGTAKIRMATDIRSAYAEALEIAKEQTDIIEDEPAYQEGQPELAALLPKIAQELSVDADEASDAQSMEKFVQLTEDALVLASNSKLIPGRLRDEGQLNDIRATIERVRQREAALNNLAETLDTMAQASADGRPRDAYAAHRQFVKQHPELVEDDRVTQAIAAAAEAEQGLVNYVQQETTPDTEEPDSPIAAELAVAAPRVEGQTSATGTAVFRLVGGLYGVSAADGQLKWRRSVGTASKPQQPLSVDDRLITFDTRRGELLCLDRDSGELIWRIALDDEIGQPTRVGDNILCPGQSGKLHVVEAATGIGRGYVQFAQPLGAAPVASADGKTLYLPGEHSSFYSLSAADFSCSNVFYLGHAKGSVSVAPVFVNGRVVVVENDGASSCTVHVLGVAEDGSADRRLTKRRIEGLTTASPHTFARRFALVTDVGQIEVFEVALEDDAPLVSLASRSPTRRRRGARYAAVHAGDLWLAGVGLSRYSISPSGNRLPVRDVEDPFRNDAFVHPLLVQDDVLIHARKRRGKPGVAIAATDLSNGQSSWQTDLMPPPAGSPVALNAGPDGLWYATAAGIYQLAPRDQRFMTNNQPRSPSADFPPVTAAGVTRGGVNYWSVSHGVNTPGGDEPPAVFALPGDLACPPAPLGEGWVVPLRLGQIHLLDPTTGQPLAAPYQPPLHPGQRLAWRRPAVFEDSLIIADETTMTAIDLIQGEPARLDASAQVAAADADAVVGRLAATSDLAFAARRNGRLTSHTPGSLETAGEVNLGAPPVWGPYAVGERVLVATADRKLHCVAANAPGELAWALELPAGDLVGAPLGQEKSAVLAGRNGFIARINLETGEPQRIIDIGQRIATGPTLAGDQLAVAAPDGAVLFLKPL